MWDPGQVSARCSRVKRSTTRGPMEVWGVAAQEDWPQLAHPGPGPAEAKVKEGGKQGRLFWKDEPACCAKSVPWVNASPIEGSPPLRERPCCIPYYKGLTHGSKQAVPGWVKIREETGAKSCGWFKPLHLWDMLDMVLEHGEWQCGGVSPGEVWLGPSLADPVEM